MDLILFNFKTSSNNVEDKIVLFPVELVEMKKKHFYFDANEQINKNIFISNHSK